MAVGMSSGISGTKKKKNEYTAPTKTTTTTTSKPSGTSSGGYSGGSGSSGGVGTLTKNADGSYTRNLNGQNYTVSATDPRYSSIAAEYASRYGGQSGGISGTSNNVYGSGDYYSQITNAINSGASADVVQRLLQERQAKINADPSLQKYANQNNISGIANAYIQNAQALEQMRQMQADYEQAIMELQNYRQNSEWGQVADELARAALEMNYADWTGSDQYAALADRYGHQGRLSMQDVLGQISARTGGMASSYAATAAQQQYNEYMAQLEEVARSMYDQEYAQAVNNAELAYQYDANEYQRYLNELALLSDQQNFGYQVLADTLAQSNYANEWGNALMQQQYDQNMAARDDARARISDYLTATQGAGNVAGALGYDVIQQAGYTGDELQALKQMFMPLLEEEITGTSSGGSSGGSRRSSGSNGGNPGGDGGDGGDVGASGDPAAYRAALMAAQAVSTKGINDDRYDTTFQMVENLYNSGQLSDAQLKELLGIMGALNA